MIPWASPHYWGNEREYVMQAIESTWISGGPFVERLENGFSSSCGSKFSLAVANGTCALHLAFLGAGLKPGDEVLIPGFAFLGAANVAIHMGLKPVFCEVDPDTWCMDPDDVARKITTRTKAIVPIHTYGNSCDMDGIMSLSKSANIVVIEDAAESIGTEYKGKWTGTIGRIGCYSLHATKTISTGEGGMVVTDDQAIFEAMQLYRSHGMRRKGTWYQHEVPGHNFRLTNMQAAMGCAQLENASNIFYDRRLIHQRYMNALSGQRGVTPQMFRPEVYAVPWSFACTLDPNEFGPRDEVMKKMFEEGIETRPGFYPASVQGIYEKCLLPTCEQLASMIISLPGSPPSCSLDVDKVCSILLSLRKEPMT